jgi:DNA polymerase-3 subunit delta'
MAESDADRSPQPRANPDLLGQEAAEAELLSCFRSGRLPHAWLIAGRGGIGKATLAFRFARFLLAGGDPAAEGLAVPAEHPVFRRIAASGHADLLTVERQFDDEKGRTKKEIAVDDVRRIGPFLRLTAAEGGWRIVVVDGADGMNRAGQNAILKILEEPPARALLLLVTERPAALLPTIRSRCRVLTVGSLSNPIVQALVAKYRPDIEAEQRVALAEIAEGSIGRALDIAANDGLTLLSNFLSIAAGDPLDWTKAHALGDRLGAAAADESYRTLSQLLVEWLGRVAREAARGVSQGQRREIVPGELELAARLAEGRLERVLEVWEKVGHLFSRSDGANLDRRLTVISALDAVSGALH